MIDGKNTVVKDVFVPVEGYPSIETIENNYRRYLSVEKQEAKGSLVTLPQTILLLAARNWKGLWKGPPGQCLLFLHYMDQLTTKGKDAADRVKRLTTLLGSQFPYYVTEGKEHLFVNDCRKQLEDHVKLIDIDSSAMFSELENQVNEMFTQDPYQATIDRKAEEVLNRHSDMMAKVASEDKVRKALERRGAKGWDTEEFEKRANARKHCKLHVDTSSSSSSRQRVPTKDEELRYLMAHSEEEIDDGGCGEEEEWA